MKHSLFILALVCIVSSCNAEEKKDDIITEELSAPAGLVCSSVSETSATLEWESAENALAYKYKLLKGMTLVESAEIEGQSVTFDGLESDTDYKFAVKSTGADSESQYSDYLEFSTNAAQVEVPDPDPIVSDDIYTEMMIPAEEDALGALAFPGAQGGGMYTTGGRGGTIYHVTSLLDNTSEGTLRYAVNQKGARTIVFDVAGTINLGSPLEISNGDLTIAGQTAPGDGICIKGRYTRISADNVIIRYVRFRLGDDNSGLSDSDDAIWGRYCSNIILDHCSMSWSVDECASFYSNSNFTMQWCYIAESMRNCSVHTKGDHGYGGIWGGENASFHHNILAHHDSRNPRFDHPHIYENHTSPAQRGVVDFRNNVVYDWGNNNSYGGEGYGAGKGTGINMVANYYKPGDSSTDRKYFLDAYGVYTSTCSTCGANVEDGYPLVYINGNIHSKYSDISDDNASGIYWHNGEGHTNYGVTASSQFAVSGPSGQKCYTTTHSAQDALEITCSLGGASLRRDEVDERTASDVKNGQGQIIDCVTSTSDKTSVAGLYGFTWPSLEATDEEILIASTDTDKDGIPDYYEKLFGLDPSDASDGQAISIDKLGRYTNFELYLHYLVREITAAQDDGGTYTEN